MAGNLALYRKYRSATFAEVKGQDHVTGPLSTALDKGRVNHAYLFSGPRGCGKTSSARILARSLNCLQGPTSTPCGVCDSCIELAPNGSGSIDVIEIDAASHGGVDDARELRERAHFSPVRDRYKVYIIDEAHMVTTQGFNALLKLVEEPPDFLVFIFATTEPDKVLATIRSRTHHYPFRLIAPGVMRTHLENICTAEGIAVEPAVLPLVVRAGGGSARDSLSVLDQLLAGAEPGGVTYVRAVALLGVTDAALLDDMVDALAAGDAAAVYSTVDRLVEAGHDPRRFAADLLDRLRDLLILDAVPDAGERGLLDQPVDQLARMVDQSGRLGAAALARFGEIVHAALVEMRGTTSPRLVLELVCARMLLPDAAADSAALLQRLERLERRSVAVSTAAEAVGAPATTPPKTNPPKAAPAKAAPAKAAPAKGAPANTVPATPNPATANPATANPATTDPATAASATSGTATDAKATAAKTPAAEPAPARAAEPPATSPPAGAAVIDPALSVGTLDAIALRRLWPEVVDVVKQTSRRVQALLEHAQITAVAGNLVTVGVSSPPFVAMISEERNSAVLREALTSVVGGTWRVAVELAGAEPPETAADPRDDTDLADAPPTAIPADPEADALRLLESTLGARPLES